jgi:hypothetical protein
LCSVAPFPLARIANAWTCIWSAEPACCCCCCCCGGGPPRLRLNWRPEINWNEAGKFRPHVTKKVLTSAVTRSKSSVTHTGLTNKCYNLSIVFKCQQSELL